jgi:superfamily II DNA/RNA helicase
LIFIGQFFIEYKNDKEKFDAIKRIYQSISNQQSMIFCNDQHSANVLKLQMKNDKQSVQLFSSESTIDLINYSRILIVTNTCPCQININNVSLVVNFQFPLLYDHIKHYFTDKPDYDTYYQRIELAQRSGRIGYV